ncbi:hypothetical protein B0J13DRAFT_603175 [Dactylonectria estremocensis]|uniref:Uncharacterized protein n=1 Tax=Dactylonectria estremocensis TaxID=1079267 RepID=A0A9P9JGT2_9HYPO|nr:hypothetical protein B0J13DRAFT_603175 [Dactylonectria estremocensis]
MSRHYPSTCVMFPSSFCPACGTTFTMPGGCLCYISPSTDSPVRSSPQTTIAAAVPVPVPDDPPPRRTRTRPCPVCNNEVTLNAYADHLKVHKLLTEEHGVKAGRPCEGCRLKGRDCRVARVPGARGLNTFRCRSCLQYHECCSYTKELRGLDKATLEVHPGVKPARATEGSGEGKLDLEPE